MQYDQQSEANKAKLLTMAKQPGNKECADCTSRSVKWACFDHGTFVCIKCSGIHRSLGRHISKVKSLTLDKWTAEEMAGMRGNIAANLEYLYNLPDGLNKPDEQDDTGRRKWIERKYVKREWARRQDQPLGQGAMERRGAQATPSLPEVSSTSSLQAGSTQLQGVPSQPSLQPQMQQALFSTSPQAYQHPAQPAIPYTTPVPMVGGFQQAGAPAPSSYQLGQLATPVTPAVPVGIQPTTQQQNNQELIKKILEQQNQYMQQYNQYQQYQHHAQQAPTLQQVQQVPLQIQQYYQIQQPPQHAQPMQTQQPYQQTSSTMYQQFTSQY